MHEVLMPAAGDRAVSALDGTYFTGPNFAGSFAAIS
jgi:hypothetical protein